MDEPVRSSLARFSRDEDGAVTVDWIVLTASLVFLGIAAAYYVTSSVPEVADSVGDYMTNYQVGEWN